MFKSKKHTNVVGLDIEAGSVAATEVSVNGTVEVVGHAVAPLPHGAFRDGEIVDPEALGETFKQLFTENKLSRDVRLGIASQRVAVRRLRLPLIESDEELETAIRFQAQDHIPMPLDQAVLDWEVVGRRLGGDDPGVDVVAVAARRDMLGTAMEAMRHGGLRPVAIDLSAFGMIRALGGAADFAPAPTEYAPAPDAATVDMGVPEISYEERMAQQAAAAEGMGQPAMEDIHRPARLFCHLGDILNLAVAQGSSCLFTRISLHGIEGIAQRLAENRELTLEHARQWLGHVGLETPLDQIAGDPEIVAATRAALEEGVVKLAAEMRVSLEYYGAQGGSTAVEGVVACGPGSAIPGLVERLERELGYRFSVGRPPALAHLDPAAAARLTLSYGLALDE